MAYSAGQELSSLAFDKIIGGALDAVVKAQNDASMTTVSFIKTVGFKNNGDGGNETPVYVDFKYPKEVAPYQPAVRTASVMVENGGTNYDPTKTAFSLNNKPLGVDVDIRDGVIISVRLKNPSDVENEVDGTPITVVCDNGDAPAASGAVVKLTVTEREAVNAKFQDMTLQIPLLTMMPIPFIRIASTDIEFNVKINSVNTTSNSEESQSNVSNTTNASYKSWWSPVSVSTSFSASFASQKKSSSTEEIKKEFSLNIKVHAVQDEMPAGVSKVLDILEESIVSQPVVK